MKEPKAIFRQTCVKKCSGLEQQNSETMKYGLWSLAGETDICILAQWFVIVRHDFTTLESYAGWKCFIFTCDIFEVNSTTTAFRLQTSSRNAACIYVIGQCSALRLVCCRKKLNQIIPTELCSGNWTWFYFLNARYPGGLRWSQWLRLHAHK